MGKFLDEAGLTHYTEKLKTLLADKQDKLSGSEGQVVGFDADGKAAAQNLPGVKLLSTAIPKGRMRGDVDGDGVITNADAKLATNLAMGVPVEIDEFGRWCADSNGTGDIDLIDSTTIGRHAKGLPSSIVLSDYYQTWSYIGEDSLTGHWEATVNVPGLTTGMSAVIAIAGEWGNGMFSGAVIVDGAVRISSARPPITDVPCVVLYGEGDGTAVVCRNSFLSAEDIGAAKTPYIKDIYLSSSGWDVQNHTITVSVNGVNSDRSTQLINIYPEPLSAVEYARCIISISAIRTNALVLHAETIPENDLDARVVITNLA